MKKNKLITEFKNYLKRDKDKNWLDNVSNETNWSYEKIEYNKVLFGPKSGYEVIVSLGRCCYMVRLSRHGQWITNEEQITNLKDYLNKLNNDYNLI